MRDKFEIALMPFSALVFGIFALMLIIFFANSIQIFEKEGLAIYTTSRWLASEDPSLEFYGVLPAIYGSLYTSAIAISIALPLSIAYSVFVVDYVPRRIKKWLVIATDIMAGLPTIIYGIWGAFILVPFVKKYLMEPLYENFSFIPLFSYPPSTGHSFLSGGILLGVMVTPFAAAIIREAYRTIPYTYREAIYALGTTRYEATRVLIGYIKPAILAGLVLAFGRAIGETAAVSLVIGNTFNISPSLFAPGYTISSLIANQFGNAFIYKYMVSALFAAGLSLFFIGLAVNLLVFRMLRRWEYARS